MKDFLKKINEQTLSVIAIDFDGVIHKNSMGFYDGTIYDNPVEGVKEALKCLSRKFQIVIFTCKAKPNRPLVNGKSGKRLIVEWLRKHDLFKYISDITHEKPRAMFYIDDKGIKFESWKQVMEEIE
jgi:histidinol phosphatase-like enzyme